MWVRKMKRSSSYKRREFLRWLATASSVATTAPLLSACTRIRGRRGNSAALGASVAQSLGLKDSNVLFICIDDLNDWASPWGGYPGAVHTPNLERLVKRGIKFQNAYN